MTPTLFLALSPIILITALLLLRRLSLVIAAPITLIFTAILALLVWQMNLNYFLASTYKGIFVAFDIALIVFGAVLFLELLQKTGIVSSLGNYLHSLSPDYRIQAIILAWFLGSFIEGTSGFGTPAAIVAPLLVGIGFPAVTAVAVALVTNNAAVAFGAVGTPIRIGFSGLEISGVPYYAALINLFAGLLVPFLILFVLWLSQRDKSLKFISDAAPFALWAGFCLMVPYFLSSFLGQEFPSIIGPLVGLGLIILTTKKALFLPKTVLRLDKDFLGGKQFPLKVIFAPYTLLILLLVAGRYLLPSFSVPLALGVEHTIHLFNPGIAFILVSLITAFFLKVKRPVFGKSLSESFHILVKPFLVILFVTVFVQLMLNSEYNSSGLPGMIKFVALALETPYLSFISPFIGAFGSFIAGSATVSNLTFGHLQFSAAGNLGLETNKILALQLVGAGVGNMIALSNIVAAQATVKLHGREGEVLKKNILPCLAYLVIVGLAGLLIIGSRVF